MRTFIYKTSVNIGYVIDYVIKERKSLNGADSTIQKASNDKMSQTANYSTAIRVGYKYADQAQKKKREPLLRYINTD